MEYNLSSGLEPSTSHNLSTKKAVSREKLCIDDVEHTDL